MFKKILITVLLVSCAAFVSCSESTETSESSADSEIVASTQADEKKETETEKEKEPVSEEVAALCRDGGKWEAIDIEEGVTEYNGVSARVFNQWAFKEDGTCIFYLNGGPTEIDDFVFDEGSSTEFSIYVNGKDSGGLVLDFSYDGEHIYWNGDGFKMTFERVSEHTTIPDDVLNKALGAGTGN